MRIPTHNGRWDGGRVARCRCGKPICAGLCRRVSAVGRGQAPPAETVTPVPQRLATPGGASGATGCSSPARAAGLQGFAAAGQGTGAPQAGGTTWQSGTTTPSISATIPAGSAGGATSGGAAFAARAAQPQRFSPRHPVAAREETPHPMRRLPAVPAAGAAACNGEESNELSPLPADHPAQVAPRLCRQGAGGRRRADHRADHDQHADHRRRGHHRADPPRRTGRRRHRPRLLPRPARARWR